MFTITRMAEVCMPDETLDNILARLPGKSLLRSRCVSKHWNRLISDPCFMKLRSRQMILFGYPWLLVVIDDNVPVEDKAHFMLKIPSLLEYAIVYIVGTFSGLVILVFTDMLSRGHMILYNPLTRASKTLAVMDPPSNRYLPYVFGFDTNELKVVRFEFINHPTQGRIFKCDVFHLKTSLWSTPPRYFKQDFYFWIDEGLTSIISCLSLANGGYMETKGKHMQYSKFFNVMDTKKSKDHELKFSSRNGMLLAYTPAFLVGLVSFAIFHNRDLRFVMAISVLTIHFFKRVLDIPTFSPLKFVEHLPRGLSSWSPSYLEFMDPEEGDEIDHCGITCPRVLPVWRKVWSWWNMPSPVVFPSFLVADVAMGRIDSFGGSRMNKVLHGVLQYVAAKIKEEDIFPGIQRVSNTWISARLKAYAPNWDAWISRKMKAIQDAIAAKTIPTKTDIEILDEVLKSTNRAHIAGVGRQLAGTGNSDSRRSQPDTDYCTQEQLEDRKRQHALEIEEQRKAFESQQNVLKKFVNFFNRQQGTPSSQFQIPDLYTPQLFPGSISTPGGPSSTSPAPSSTPLGLGNCYTPTFDPETSQSGEQDNNGSDDGNREYDVDIYYDDIWKWRNRITHADLDVAAKIKEEDIFPGIQRVSKTWISARLKACAPNWDAWISRTFNLFSV
ncbi:F-box domain containing protein [Tanacetum coccineum]